jgi:cold shock CspA family protein
MSASPSPSASSQVVWKKPSDVYAAKKIELLQLHLIAGNFQTMIINPLQVASELSKTGCVISDQVAFNVVFLSSVMNKFHQHLTGLSLTTTCGIRANLGQAIVAALSIVAPTINCLPAAEQSLYTNRMTPEGKTLFASHIEETLNSGCFLNSSVTTYLTASDAKCEITYSKKVEEYNTRRSLTFRRVNFTLNSLNLGSSLTGTVLFYNKKSHCGFIATESNGNIYYTMKTQQHAKGDTQKEMPNAGEKVSFKICQDKKGRFFASNIALTD